jgi:hypothetical protein
MTWECRCGTRHKRPSRKELLAELATAEKEAEVSNELACGEARRADAAEKERDDSIAVAVRAKDVLSCVRDVVRPGQEWTDTYGCLALLRDAKELAAWKKRYYELDTKATGFARARIKALGERDLAEDALRKAWRLYQESGVMREPNGQTGNVTLDDLGIHLDEWSGAGSLIHAGSPTEGGIAVSTLNHHNPDVARVAAALADARLAGGLSPAYYRRTDDALARIALAMPHPADAKPCERCEKLAEATIELCEYICGEAEMPAWIESHRELAENYQCDSAGSPTEGPPDTAGQGVRPEPVGPEAAGSSPAPATSAEQWQRYCAIASASAGLPAPEDRSEPRPGYSIVEVAGDELPYRPRIGAGAYRTREEAVVASWEHGDGLVEEAVRIMLAKHKEEGSK